MKFVQLFESTEAFRRVAFIVCEIYFSKQEKKRNTVVSEFKIYTNLDLYRNCQADKIQPYSAT